MNGTTFKTQSFQFGCSSFCNDTRPRTCTNGKIFRTRRTSNMDIKIVESVSTLCLVM